MIISRTPFRVSFFGGGTDFPSYYDVHGGATLSTTINKHCYISVHHLSSFFDHKFRASYAKTELVATPDEFAHPLIRECLMYLKMKEGMEITHIADLPGQTGLGSSSSFTVGLLHSLHAFAGETVSSEQLAQEAITVERERVGDEGGHQDQYAAAYGGLLRIDYLPEKGPVVKRLCLPDIALRDFEQHLMIFYMGNGRSAQDILREQTKRMGHNESVLEEMRQMVGRAEDILTGGEPVTEIGKLLRETWKRKKSLSAGISTPHVDEAYKAALAAGALGGKLLGAGGRGFLLVFAEPSCRKAVREKLSSLKEVSFAISSKGSHIVYHSGE